MKLSLEQGRKAVALARAVVQAYFETGKKLAAPKARFLQEKRGIFVSIHSASTRRLRGCIGFPKPVMPLGEAIVEAAGYAAFGDSRFQPLVENELKTVVFEVSVLTVPKKLSCPALQRPQKIKMGKDGLIAKKGSASGLLLPQVAVEWKWDSTEFLANACLKAGLNAQAWKNNDVEISVFQAQVFQEK